MKSRGPLGRNVLAQGTPSLALAGLLSIMGCTSETPPTPGVDGQTGAGPVSQSTVPPDQAGMMAGKVTSATAQPSPANRPHAPPTRSELRVMAEQAKGGEAEIKGLIQQFDANLDDPLLRKKTEQALNAALPEYKEKMLAIGKARLRDAE